MVTPARIRGFTLIELMVVMAIIAVLLTVALPRYFAHVDRSKEVVLKENLAQMRDAIDKFYADKGAYPPDLPELVAQRYLRALPVDPVTDSAQTWIIVAPPATSQARGGVYDVRSGAPGAGRDGRPYADW